MCEEIWKGITYAPNYYVSNLGRIKNKKDRLLLINYDRLQKTKTRARPGLSVNGKLHQYYLHRIVAEHFIDNPNNLPEVNHKDGNFYNNTVLNLEWISKNDNMKHARDNNLMNRFKVKVKCTCKQTGKVTTYSSMTECARAVDISTTTVSKYCNGKITNKLYDFEIVDNRVPIDEDCEWREYPECTKYMVSNTGQVKHKRMKNVLAGSMVNGYKFVGIKNENGVQLNRLVHRMVAMTFLENPLGLPVVDHLDTDPLNNRVGNLRWCSYKDNMNNELTLQNLKAAKGA
jgi:hypothetical protein